MTMNPWKVSTMFLSGALFPLQDLPRWLTVLTHLNPITYAVDPMRQAVFWHLDGSAETSSAIPVGTVATEAARICSLLKADWRVLARGLAVIHASMRAMLASGASLTSATNRSRIAAFEPK